MAGSGIGGSRVDLHCHSTASHESRLGVQRSLGLPECATPPEEVYELAKRRGMDFVTITDHDTIAGALEIADRPDAFVSVELTAWFSGEPQAVHVLCWGISPADHEALQGHAHDVEEVAGYLDEKEIPCALAHPFYSVAAPLTGRHRGRLAHLFPVWETLNGARAPELNLPAAVYTETRGGVGVGGSDDHAGVDVGRTWTETPPVSTPEELLAAIRRGDATPHGDQGSAAKWAHAALALAIRALPPSDEPATLDPRAVLAIVEEVMSQGDARSGPATAELGPSHACALLHAWLATIGVATPRELLAWMQEDGFSHAELQRRALRSHDRALRAAVGKLLAAAGDPGTAGTALAELLGACMPAVPYVAAGAFLAKEKRKLAAPAPQRRVAVFVDGIGSVHGVARTIDEVRERGVPGFDVEVIGTDPNVDRRLPAVADVEVPAYPGMVLGVPGLPAVVETLGAGAYDLIHVCSPGPAGVAALVAARITGLPLVGSYHTELGPYVELRTGNPVLRALAEGALGAFYGQCELVLSPSPSADESLVGLGIAPERIARWDRGVDTARFRPGLRDPETLPGELSVLYSGRVTAEKGAHLLADAFERAAAVDARLQLVVAGGGPEEHVLRERLGERVSFLGWLEGDELARAYASADLLVFSSATDTLGQVILEAQASGLPVVAVARGGPRTLIEDGRSGRLCGAGAAELAEAILELAGQPLLRRRLAEGGLAAVSDRSWERALERLAAGYERVLSAAEARRTAA
jgi:glycosyltransferase involved in cell wall biosynthesis/predicted metal-dependent phosphoesterase TrpH